MSQTIFLALGSNVGESATNIRQAIDLLSSTVENMTEAPIYTSKAVGYTEQPDFLNTAVRGETELTPMELLKFVKDIEAEIGRVHRFRWGPREIDIDIIFYGTTILETAELIIPHPRFAERDFVLRPIADIDADFRVPASDKTVKQVLDNLPPSELTIL